jgi:transposase
VVPGGAPGSGAVLEGLRQIQASARALLDQGHVEETWQFLLAALEAALVQNRDLTLLVAKLRRASRGTRSERLDPGQLSLLVEVLLAEGTGAVPVDPEAEAREDAVLDRAIEQAEQERTAAAAPKGRDARRRGAGWHAPGVERQVHQVEVPDGDRTCAHCGRTLTRLGTDITRRLCYVPGHFEEHEYHLATYACGRCKEGVTTAPAPPQVLPRSAADASVLAQVVVSKYADHTPLHRQHRIYARSGVDISVSTLSDWTAGVGDLVQPVVERLADRVLGASIVGTDATGLKVLDPKSPEHVQRGSIWALIGDYRDVLFRYTPTGEGASGPWAFLGGRRGYIQADASNVFDRLFNGQAASAVELGCWSHNRRYLVDLEGTDCRVAYPLKLIARLYRIEHLADARELTPEARRDLRHERSVPLLQTLQRWFVATKQSEPPSTDLARAAGYALNHWTALTRFLEDGRIRLDNNVTEQQLRDIALGRRNFLFAGSHDAARRTANLYSLTRTCAQYGVPPLPYITDLLATLAAGWPRDRMDDLLPHRWHVRNAATDGDRLPP